MKCISLIEPWALLVVLGAKRFETRRWQTEHRGPLAIHACRRFPDEARALCRQEPFRSVLLRAGFRQSADLPTGVIVGTVEMVDCLPAATVLAQLHDDPAEVAFGDFSNARWAWQLARPYRLTRPVHCTGRLGLFDAPPLQLPLPFLDT